MIIADTSAWVHFLRDTGHPAGLALERLLITDSELAVTEIVVMEVLAGARSDVHAREIRARLVALPVLRLEGLADYEEAALIYRSCRAAGETIRNLSDCLIAVPAVRTAAEVLHDDSDFDAIARNTELRIYPLNS